MPLGVLVAWLGLGWAVRAVRLYRERRRDEAGG
jgi:hypothetical protein